MAVAFFSTWTTHGTWLRGDRRGWYEPGRGLRLEDRLKEFRDPIRTSQSSILLDFDQRRLVEKTIRDHCTIRCWTLHAVNCRSNHVHALVTAPGRDIDVPRKQFKAWCTRKLMERERGLGVVDVRDEWWTERGWDEYVDDENGLSTVIAYIIEGQDSDRFDS
jgi:REP element-mobilizing transposase RayT